MTNNFSRYISKVFLLVALLAAAISCKKKEEAPPPVPVRTAVMTVNFTGDYINPKLGAIVFASDSLGKVIADTAFSGNGKLVLYAPPGIQVPARFTLTIATWEPSMHNFEIIMRSYTDVTTGEWTLQGHRPDTLGHFTVNLTNVPQGALVLYANAGFANLTTKTSQAVCLTYVDPDDLYIKFERNNTVKHLWINGVHPGMTYDADMAEATVPDFRTLSMSGVFYEARVWGYHSTDYENDLPVMTNHSLGSVPAGNMISLSDLPGRFAGYRTEMSIIESWDSAAMVTCRFTGDIPASFSRIDARIASKSIYPGHAELHATGDYTAAAVAWGFQATNNQLFRWTMYGDRDRTNFMLPDLPPSMLQTFPVLAPDSLIFVNIELSKYHGIATYTGYLSRRFDPLHPRSEDKFDASTLVSTQGK